MQALCGTVCRHPISSALGVLCVLCGVFPISVRLLFALFQHFTVRLLVLYYAMDTWSVYLPMDRGVGRLGHGVASEQYKVSCPLLSKPPARRAVSNQLRRILRQILNHVFQDLADSSDSCNVLPCLEGLYHNAHLLICISQGDSTIFFFYLSTSLLIVPKKLNAFKNHVMRQ